MKVGDLVRHVRTDRTALLIRLWADRDLGGDRDVVMVIFNGRKVRWLRSSTEILS